MANAFNQNELMRWRSDPIAFIETALHDPETKKPFHLLDAERIFLQHAFKLDEHGKLLYPELLYSCPKKSGKTTFAGIFALTLLLLYGGSYPEATICANDQEQSIGRVFTMIRRIIECSPLLRAAAKITEARITFPALDVTINAIPSSFAGAAGGNQNISVFDELWGFVAERSRRLWDELVPPPTRKIACRLTVTYAGYEGESLLLQELYKRGLQQQTVGRDLYAGDGLLMFWSHVPIAPWQDKAWLASMRRASRANAYLRLVENRFVTSESQFVDMSAWDACVQPSLSPTHDRVPIWVGVDASVKRDSTALVAVGYDTKTKVCRLVTHRIFTPSVINPIDFEKTIEQTILEWRKRYALRNIYFDPFQMVGTAQRLAKQHVPIEEYPQTLPNLTAMTENLFDLIQSRSLMLYPDAVMRLAASRAVLAESSRGMRIGKEKQSHHVDVIVALAMACLACIKGQAMPGYDLFAPGLFDDEDDKEAADQLYRQQLAARIFQLSGGQCWPR